MLRKGLQRLQPLQRKLAAEKQDIYSGSALLGALKLVVIATDVPSQPRDQRLTSMLREEGFSVTWLPPITSAHRFVSEIERVDDELERSDQYAVVAFRRAATFALDCFRRPAWPNLRAVVAYYPSRLPRSDGDGGELTFDPKFHVKVHLARTQPPPSEFRGSGAYFYVYPFSDVGFAEDHHAAFDPIDARLAWSRTLASLRAGFGIPNYIEHVWDQYLRMDLAANPAEDPTALMSDNVYYNLVPLMLGVSWHKSGF
ncbi:hypothetical protein KEM52_000937 [Ascosphaera acerosa]|nr:hypothetical protein KEM52_000937 [Ascosphaera acerosa]